MVIYVINSTACVKHDEQNNCLNYSHSNNYHLNRNTVTRQMNCVGCLAISDKVMNYIPYFPKSGYVGEA